MRKALALTLGAALAASIFATPVLAGGRHDDYVCWMMPSGHTKCGYVTDPYHVRGLGYKPHRHTDRRHCVHCYSDHVLSNPSIRDLGNYTDNSTMRRFHDSTFYGEKNRGDHN